MDYNTVNNSGAPIGSASNENGQNGQSEKKEHPVGPTIGLILILVLILMGGIYFWTSRTGYAPGLNGNTDSTNGTSNTETSTEEINQQSSSDEAGSIETDLNAFGEADIEGLDSSI